MGEVIILNEICPDWKLHSAFISGYLEDALKLDSRRSSHPIQVDCPDANQINQIVRYLIIYSFNCVLTCALITPPLVRCTVVLQSRVQ